VIPNHIINNFELMRLNVCARARMCVCVRACARAYVYVYRLKNKIFQFFFSFSFFLFFFLWDIIFLFANISTNHLLIFIDMWNHIKKMITILQSKFINVFLFVLNSTLIFKNEIYKHTFDISISLPFSLIIAHFISGLAIKIGEESYNKNTNIFSVLLWI